MDRARPPLTGGLGFDSVGQTVFGVTFGGVLAGAAPSVSVLVLRLRGAATPGRCLSGLEILRPCGDVRCGYPVASVVIGTLFAVYECAMTSLSMLYVL